MTIDWLDLLIVAATSLVAAAVVVTLFSLGVFSYALGLPFERFGPWLRF